MKNIVGKEAKIYNYIINVFMTVSDYYNYEYVEMPILVENTHQDLKELKEYDLAEIKDTNLIVRPSIEASVRNYYIQNEKGFKKYCYFGNVHFMGREEKRFGFLAANINSVYQDAEMISMIYRILEELKLEDITVKLEASKKYDLKKLQSYLEHLEVDYEIGKLDELMEDATPLRFEIVINARDKEIPLVNGARSNNKFEAISCSCYLNNILDVLNVVYENREFDVLTQVYILSETEEEKISAMKLAQDLRWCEIKVDMDTSNKTKDEQRKNITNTNFIIDMDKDNLNKGLIKVIDFYTKDETLVDEAEIIDYIVSNI